MYVYKEIILRFFKEKTFEGIINKRATVISEPPGNEYVELTDPWGVGDC